ncbi:hypothetical protein P5V15_002206 [Pogonomyrmex californicus]
MRTTHAPRTSDPFRSALVYEAKLFEVLDEKEGKRRPHGEAGRVFLAEGMFSRSSKLAVSTPAIYPFFSRRGFLSSATWRQGQGNARDSRTTEYYMAFLRGLYVMFSIFARNVPCRSVTSMRGAPILRSNEILPIRKNGKKDLKKIFYLVTNQHITRSKNLSNTTNGGDGETKKYKKICVFGKNEGTPGIISRIRRLWTEYPWLCHSTDTDTTDCRSGE